MDSKKYEYLVKKYDLNKKNLKSNIRRIFEPVAKRIVSDIHHGSSENYIKDNTGKDLKKALDELSRCGISGLDSVKRDVGKHCWYMELDTYKVKRFQRLLCELKYLSSTDISGVYDKATHKAWEKILSDLKDGQFVTLGNATVDHANLTKDMLNTLERTTKVPVLIKEGGGWMKEVIKKANTASKKITIAGNSLLVTGALLDIVELYQEFEKHLTDVDKKMGKRTAITFGKIVGSWGGYAIGSYVGGAAATAILVATGSVGILAAPFVQMAIIVTFTSAGEDVGGWFGKNYGQACIDNGILFIEKVDEFFDRGLVYASNSPEYRGERAR